MRLVTGAPGRACAGAEGVHPCGRGSPRLIRAAVLGIMAAGAACAGSPEQAGPPQTAGETTATAGPPSFAIYALSRGSGVPDRTRAALAEAKSVLEDMRGRGAEVTISQERIGLEGETRLCVTFADPEVANRMLERVREIARGVDLLNLTREPCVPKGAP